MRWTGYLHLWLSGHYDNIDCHDWDLKIILLRGLDGGEGLTLVIGARSNASLLFFLRVLHHDFVGLASRLECVSTVYADLPSGSCGFSPMFILVILP